MLFHINLNVTTDHDDDRKYQWSAFLPGTSFRVYATTKKSAEKRLKKAFKMGLNALHDAGGAEGVKMYLERHSIPYLAKDENLVTVETGRGRQLVHAAE